MQIDVPAPVQRLFSVDLDIAVSVAILVIGLLVSYLVWRYTHYFLADTGVREAVEGTPFERAAQRFGTSTVSIVAALAALFVYVGPVLIALNVSQLLSDIESWPRFVDFLSNLFVAVFALITGLIAGDKAKLSISNRLRNVKFPQAELLPIGVKYSIIFVAILVALGQLGVVTAALLILLGAYAFGLVFLCGLAFRNLLAAGAVGLYLVLSQPYSIGDEVRIDQQRGIVQEVDMFVTRIESDGEEYIIPNDKVFTAGVVRIRN